MLENGMFLVDRYEIMSKVGAGGMSDVYKAKDHILGRIVAVKVLKPEFSEDVNFVTKFRTEAQSAAGLEHPNIVNIYDVGSENGLHFIVMEYVEGITLKTYVEKKGQLSFKEATSIAIQVARGIEIAHNKEIIHRDIKPQNIIISTEGKVKVTDFGIARAISSNTISAEVMGSVHYASPEQARNGYVDGRSDIYSLGIVMYEMVTGRVPFDGDTTVSVAIQHLQEEMVEPSVYAPDLPISYEKIVLKATQKSPDRRYQSIEEILADLRKALVSPDEDFVVIAPLQIAKTRVIGGEELEAIQNSAENADLDKENAYANTQDDDDEYDEYDEYDEEDDEEDNTGFLNPKFDKAVTIGLIAVAVISLILVIWLGVSIANLFRDKPNGPDTSKKPTQSESISDTDSDSATEPTEPGTDDYVKMVNVLDLSIERATDILESLGLEINVIAYEKSDKADGTILNQSVEEDEMVAPGTVINVVVAGDNDSKVEIKVPKLVGETEANARKILQSLGFIMEVDYETSDTVAKDLIISQDPEEGTKKKKGSTIKVVVSEGKKAAAVPGDLIGKDYSAAEYALQSKGFKINLIKEYNADSTKAGTVLKITFENADVSGKSAPYGSTLDVVVATNKKTVPSDLTSKTLEAAKKALTDLGYKVEVKEVANEAKAGTIFKVVDKDTDTSVLGKELETGKTVVIYVSTGAEEKPEMILVPDNLKGKTLAEVKAELKSLGFKVSDIISEDGTAATEGTVVDIKEGTTSVLGKEVEKGKELIIVVTKKEAENPGGETPENPDGENPENEVQASQVTE